jgi:ubiquinone biosynthesis protein UbiJ
MAKVTPDMSDAQVIEVLKSVGGSDPAKLREVMKDASPRQAFAVAIPWGIQSQPDVVAQLAGIEGSVLWVVEGEGGGKFAICFSGGKVEVKEGDKPDATATVTLDINTWKELASGESNPQAAFMSGKIQIAGDLSLIMQIQGVLPMG